MNSSQRIIPILLGAALLAPASAAVTATRASLDAIVGLRQTSGPALGYYTGATGVSTTTVGGTGSTGSRFVQNLVYRYNLPTLSVGQTIESFSFSFQITGLRDHSDSSYELDVYLLDQVDPTSTGSSLFVDSATDPANAFVGSHFIETGADTSTITLTDPVDVTFTINSGPSLALLQGFYGGDHIPDQDWASFRFNLDKTFANLGTQALNRYVINSDDASSSFEITAIPEPSTALLSALGLLALLRRRR